MLSWADPDKISYYLVLLALAGVIFALVRVVRFQPFRVTFCRPRLESLIATPVAMSAFILLFAVILLAGPSAMGRQTGRPVYDLNSVKLQATNYVEFLLPIAVLLLVRRQGLTSIGWSRQNLGRSLLIGLMLGLILTVYFLAKYGTGIASLGQPMYAYAFLTTAIIGFGEETLFRGLLQTRMTAWLGDRLGWTVASLLMAFDHLPSFLVARQMVLGLAALDVLSVLPESLLCGYLMLCARNTAAPGVLHSFLDWVEVLRQ